MPSLPGAPGFTPRKARPGLPPAAYHDPSVFQVEEEAIFRRLWVFAGFSDDLAQPNDWIARRIGGIDVVVQNFNGALRAFRNVCTHRFAVIRREPRGNGPLRCSYHGWTFDRDGVPYGIPGNDAYFGLDQAGRCARALTPVTVAACGRFVFVRVEAGSGDEGPSLDEWLGAHADLLRHASNVFVRSFDEREFLWQANWKMGVESVLEVYHADTVHPNTFRKLVKGDWRCVCGDGPHSQGVTTLSDKSARWWDGVSGRLGFRPSDRLREYDHVHIFPNLEIGFTRGAVMSVQTYDPQGPNHCALRLRLWLADPMETGGAAARRMVEDGARDLNIALLREDQEASEAAFRGARQAGFPALLGLNEERIQHFHAVWRAAVEPPGSEERL